MKKACVFVLLGLTVSGDAFARFMPPSPKQAVQKAAAVVAVAKLAAGGNKDGDDGTQPSNNTTTAPVTAPIPAAPPAVDVFNNYGRFGGFF